MRSNRIEGASQAPVSHRVTGHGETGAFSASGPGRAGGEENCRPVEAICLNSGRGRWACGKVFQERVFCEYRCSGGADSGDARCPVAAKWQWLDRRRRPDRLPLRGGPPAAFCKTGVWQRSGDGVPADGRCMGREGRRSFQEAESPGSGEAKGQNPPAFAHLRVLT